MQKIMILFGITTLLGSCSDRSKEESAVAEVRKEAPPAASPVDMPFKATYSSDWSIGDPKYTKIALDFYKGLEDDNLSGLSDYLEDSIQFRAFDNRIVKVSKDEMLKRVKDFRGGFKSIKEEFLAYVSLHSNDRNEDWVGLWIYESGTRINGKPDSTHYQENWRFRNGKLYYVADFARYKPAK